jgi:hypothetical protein
MWTWRFDLKFENWIARRRRAAIFVAAIKTLQTVAPNDVRTSPRTSRIVKSLSRASP